MAWASLKVRRWPIMAEPAVLGDPTAAPAGGPAVIVSFSAPGSADMTVKAEGISLTQLMAAAYLLDCLAREARAGELARQAIGGLTPAELQAIAGLGRIDHG